MVMGKGRREEVDSAADAFGSDLIGASEPIGDCRKLGKRDFAKRFLSSRPSRRALAPSPFPSPFPVPPSPLPVPPSHLLVRLSAPSLGHLPAGLPSSWPVSCSAVA